MSNYSSLGGEPVFVDPPVLNRVIIEIQLDNGTEYFSTGHLLGPTYPFKGEITNVSKIRRELPTTPGIPVTSKISFSIQNFDRLRSKDIDVQEYRNRKVIVSLVEVGGSLASANVAFTGFITRVNIINRELKIEAEDQLTSFLRNGNVDGKINADIYFKSTIPGIVFPLRRNFTFGNIIYGKVSSSGLSDDGWVPCPYLSTAPGSCKYLVAQHRVKSVDNVYRYGVLLNPSDYTVEYFSSGDEENWTYLNFTDNMEDDNRASEETITADVQGITDDGLPTGNLITNPIRGLEHALLNYAGFSSGDLSASDITDLESKFDGWGWGSALSGCVSKELSKIDLITRFLRTFNINMCAGIDGKLNFGSFGSEDALSPTITITEYQHMLSPLEQVDNERVYNKFPYSYGWNPAQNIFYYTKIHNNTNSQGSSGVGEVRAETELKMYMTNSSLVAKSVMQTKAWVFSENSFRCRFSTKLNTVTLSARLGDIAAITHRDGVDSLGSGWALEPNRIIEKYIDPINMIIEFRTILLNINPLSAFILGDRSTLPANWSGTTEAEKEWGYLCDRSTGKFADGRPGKQLF